MTRAAQYVLMIDDEPQVRRFLRAGFELEGFVVQEAETGIAGIKLATLRSFDLIVVDLGLPDMDGSEVISRVRAWSSTPIIVLSVRSSEEEKVKLLEAGADDYVVKPFGMAELVARARAALRRQAPAATIQPVVTVGDISIDLAHRQVSKSGAEVELTPKEYRLLQMLAQHCDKVVTHQHLLREIWGPTHVDESHHLRILVRKLRQKLESDPTQPQFLKTELGVGYRLATSRRADIPTRE